MESRNDLNDSDLLLYIKAFYRIIPHNILFKRILSIKYNDVKNLSIKNLRANIDDLELVDNMNCSQSKNSCTIQFSYSRENEGFGNMNSCKFLGFIINFSKH